tara:strand:- start:9898 stop:11313 length:1416 start_codon:yes stop_codon:yes gene_type:complete
MANIKFSQFTNDTNPNSSSFFVGYNSVSNLNVRVSKANLLTSLGAITGTGTTNYLPKFTGASALGNSLLFDNGTNVGIGTATPAYLLDVNGTARVSGILSATAGLNNTGVASNSWALSSLEGLAIKGTVINGISTITTYLDDSSIIIGSGISQKTGITINGQTSVSGSSFLVTTGGATRLTIGATGAATFSSSVTTGGQVLVNTGTVNQNTKISGSQISMSRTSDAADVVYFSKNTDLGVEGTANINGYNGIQFRTQGAGTVKATITETGNFTTTLDATINGVLVGRGGGNVSTNTAIGYQSLFSNNDTHAEYNTAIGYESLVTLNSDQAINNTAVGFQSGNSIDEGFDNTAIGSNALKNSGKYDGNTAIGSASLYNSNGDFNTALGFNSGYDLSSGQNNIFIGKGQNSIASMNGTTMIGVGDIADGDNQMRFGSASVENGMINSEDEWGYNAKWRVYINGSPYYIPLQNA